MARAKRFRVVPCDNLGSVDPPPPRDRTWDVVDSKTDYVVTSTHTRGDARAEAYYYNHDANDEEIARLERCSDDARRSHRR